MVQNLPSAEVYEKEALYMPWGTLLAEIVSYVSNETPKQGKVLDILCGTGHLLGKLRTERPDIAFTGVDIEVEYINFAKSLYLNIGFVVADALGWQSAEKYDAVLCTGGLHHIPYEKQSEFVQKISSLLKENGFAIIADPYIDDYSNEDERRVAAEKLGNAYIEATAKNHPPAEIVEATKTILANDVAGIEYKTSVKKMRPIFEKHFSKVQMYKTWPAKQTEYGDYYFILKQ